MVELHPPWILGHFQMLQTFANVSKHYKTFADLNCPDQLTLANVKNVCSIWKWPRCVSCMRGDIQWQVLQMGTSRGPCPREVPVRATHHWILPRVRETHLVLYLLYDIIPSLRWFSSYSTTKNTRNWWDNETASVHNALTTGTDGYPRELCSFLA